MQIQIQMRGWSCVSPSLLPPFVTVLMGYNYNALHPKIRLWLWQNFHCKHTAHSCVVGCKEGGALPTVTALTAQEMTIMCLFVCLLCKPENHWRQTKHI